MNMLSSVHLHTQIINRDASFPNGSSTTVLLLRAIAPKIRRFNCIQCTFTNSIGSRECECVHAACFLRRHFQLSRSKSAKFGDRFLPLLNCHSINIRLHRLYCVRTIKSNLRSDCRCRGTRIIIYYQFPVGWWMRSLKCAITAAYCSIAVFAYERFSYQR